MKIYLASTNAGESAHPQIHKSRMKLMKRRLISFFSIHTKEFYSHLVFYKMIKR